MYDILCGSCREYRIMRQRTDVDRISGRKKCEYEQRRDLSCDFKGSVAYQPENVAESWVKRDIVGIFIWREYKGTSAPLLDL